MRKSTAGILAVGSAFALTAAAASAIAVTGPFDPAAGTGPATSCAIGATTVDSMTDGSDLLGFTVTTGADSSYTPVEGETPAVHPGCENATIWVRVDYQDLSVLPTVTIKSVYAAFPANGDYRSTGADGPQDLLFGDSAPSAWWTGTDLGTASSSPSTRVNKLALESEALVRTVVLVSTTEPTNFVAEENL